VAWPLPVWEAPWESETAHVPLVSAMAFAALRTRAATTPGLGGGSGYLQTVRRRPQKLQR
jgi:hypothetical protein